MTLVLPNVGETFLLNLMTNNASTQNLTLRLYSNNYTPVEASTYASFTEATFTGYSAAALTAGSWTITAADPSTAAYPQVTFTSTAGSQNQNIYGYYVTRATGPEVVFAELFTDGPYNIANNGDAIKITLNFTMA
jgi:hypothetical protein